MRAFCTLFDRNYLVKALSLVASLDAHEGDYRLYVVCLDELTRVALERLHHPRLVLIPLDRLEAGDARLLAAKRTRSTVEYYWTLTATVLLWTLVNEPGLDVLTYLDADLFFFGPAQPIADELGAGAALIHRHDFSPDLAHLAGQSGTYNVGVVAIRNDARGLAVLEWWRDRCLEWCYNRHEDGKMGDQMYLDAWPSRFDGVVVARSRGIGTAPWNHRNGPIDADGSGRPRVGGEPIVCYHMHALEEAAPGVVVPARHLEYRLTAALLRHCYLPYVTALADARALAGALVPEFSAGLSPGVLTPRHTVVARRAHRALLQGAGFARPPLELSPDWDCLPTDQLVA